MIVEIRLFNNLKEIMIGQGLTDTKWKEWFWWISSFWVW